MRYFVYFDLEDYEQFSEDFETEKDAENYVSLMRAITEVPGGSRTVTVETYEYEPCDCEIGEPKIEENIEYFYCIHCEDLRFKMRRGK